MSAEVLTPVAFLTEASTFVHAAPSWVAAVVSWVTVVFFGSRDFTFEVAVSSWSRLAQKAALALA